MAKATTDTALTRLGDHYQYLIALECCIDAKDGDIMYVETMSDISLNSSDKREAIETKHHIDVSHQISDRHVDFWKTLKNWIKNYSLYKDYQKLILLTTSEINPSSRLSTWNEKDKHERLSILRKIQEEKVTDSIRLFVERIFSFDSNYTIDVLTDVLDKFTISSSQPTIQDKIEGLLSREYFKIIPRKNRRPFLEDLLGYIRNIGMNKPTDWQISVTEFNAFATSKARFYQSEVLPIPDLYRKDEADHSKYAEYVFVQEIQKIDLHSFVPSAVNDYHRAQKTIILLSENDPSCVDEITYYREKKIINELTLLKEQCTLEVEDRCNMKDCLKNSKKCYLRAMRIPLLPINGYEPNQDFFQKGNIHIVVNDDKFKWAIEHELPYES